MRILVTRPKTPGERTAARLAALGHEAIVLPLSEADHTPANAAQALEKTPSCLAITSAETCNTLTRLGEGLKQFLGIPVFAVGSATAQAASEIGFANVHAADGTAEDMATCLVNAMTGSKGHILYLAGNPRSDTLETCLQEHAIPFETAECYRMHPIHYTEKDLAHRFGSIPPEVVLLYSRESALLFFGLPLFARGYATLQHSWLCCFSRNIATVVPEELQHRIKIAVQPNEKAMFALLQPT